MFGAIAKRLAGLHARYAKPHRVYHTQEHVDAMLAGMRELDGAIVHEHAVELAIWYHDAIYDPASSDNENRSADLLRTEMAELVDTAMLQRAAALVRWTADHRIPPGLLADEHQDAALFLDLDMAVLGAGQVILDAYERGIAAEYVLVHGWNRFRAEREQFLCSMLARERLFHSAQFDSQYASTARANLLRALTTLQHAELR